MQPCICSDPFKAVVLPRDLHFTQECCMLEIHSFKMQLYAASFFEFHSVTSGPRILKYLNSLGHGDFLYYVAAAGTKRQWGRDGRYQKLYIKGSRDRGLVTNLGA
jgi:hypothetical protein